MSSASFNKEVIMCPICQDVLIEPITLICKHEMCKPCYDEYFEKADFKCPLCKKRLNAWARKVASKGSLVNTCKWKFLQDNFSELIERRLKGEDNCGFFPSFQVHLAKEGEIYKEYLEAKLKYEAEHKAQVDEEENASNQLIQSILKEEYEEANKQKQKQIEQDQNLAKVISEQLNQHISPRSVSKKLLRSTTSKKKKPRLSVNSIEKYCIRQKIINKENVQSSLYSIGNGNCSKSSDNQSMSNFSPPTKKHKLNNSL